MNSELITGFEPTTNSNHLAYGPVAGLFCTILHDQSFPKDPRPYVSRLLEPKAYKRFVTPYLHLSDPTQQFCLNLELIQEPELPDNLSSTMINLLKVYRRNIKVAGEDAIAQILPSMRPLNWMTKSWHCYTITDLEREINSGYLWEPWITQSSIELALKYELWQRNKVMHL